MKNNPVDTDCLTRSDSISFNKKKLRKIIQAKRDSLAIIYRKKRSKIIAEKFFLTEDYRNSNNIFLYYPFRSEIDTTIIIKKALKDGKKVILPRVGEKGLELFFIANIADQLDLWNILTQLLPFFDRQWIIQFTTL